MLSTSEQFNAYFMSDAHLGRQGPVPEEQKVAYLMELFREVSENASHLFIVGDLFDFWFEWKSAIPKETFPTLMELKSLVDRGIEVHYLAGNHDFHLTGFLETNVGLIVHPHDMEITLGGKRCSVFHGDGVLKGDGRYRLMKRIIRHPWSVAMYRLLHPDWGMAIARGASKLSNSRLALKYEDFHAEEHAAYAREKLQQGFDIVVLAHCHHPVYREFPEGTYIHIGDWIENFTYARWDHQGIGLYRWLDKSTVISD